MFGYSLHSISKFLLNFGLLTNNACLTFYGGESSVEIAAALPLFFYLFQRPRREPDPGQLPRRHPPHESGGAEIDEEVRRGRLRNLKRKKDIFKKPIF